MNTKKWALLVLVGMYLGILMYKTPGIFCGSTRTQDESLYYIFFIDKKIVFNSYFLRNELRNKVFRNYTTDPEQYAVS